MFMQLLTPGDPPLPTTLAVISRRGCPTNENPAQGRWSVRCPAAREPGCSWPGPLLTVHHLRERPWGPQEPPSCFVQCCMNHAAQQAQTLLLAFGKCCLRDRLAYKYPLFSLHLRARGLARKEGVFCRRIVPAPAATAASPPGRALPSPAHQPLAATLAAVWGVSEISYKPRGQLFPACYSTTCTGMTGLSSLPLLPPGRTLASR